MFLWGRLGRAYLWRDGGGKLEGLMEGIGPMGKLKLLNLERLGGCMLALEILDLAVVIKEALPSQVKLVEAMDVLSCA